MNEALILVVFIVTSTCLKQPKLDFKVRCKVNLKGDG